MNILFIAPRYHTNQYPIVKTLQEYGHHVDFLVLYTGKSEDRTLLKPEFVPYSRVFYLIARIMRWNITGNYRKIRPYAFPPFFYLYKKIKQLQPDLVIVRDLNNFSKITYIVARILRIPVILYDQNPLHRKQKVLWKKVILTTIRILWGKRPVRITPVPGNPHAYPAYPNTYLVPFVSNVDQKQKLYPNVDSTRKILTVGKFQPRKNLLLLIRVIEELSKELPVHLTIIGTVDTDDQHRHYDEVLAYIAEHKLESLIEIIPGVPFEKMSEQYRLHDVFVLPSKNEQFGVSVLEAMGHGLPVLCSTTAGAQYCIRNGENGYVFTSDNLTDLTQKLRKVIQSPQTIQSFGERSRSIVADEYSAGAYYRTLCEIIRKHFPQLSPNL